MKKRFEGRNLDEALENAAKGLTVERFQLSYRVVMEKRGFLGGMKRVVIEADVNEGATPPQEVDDTLQPPSLAAEEYSGQREVLRQPQRRGRGGRGRGDRDRGRRDQFNRAPRRPSGPREPVPEQAPQSENAARVGDWCEELFELADLELDARTEETDEQLMVKLYGRDASLVLSHGGELLDSLQVLANKSLVKREAGRNQPHERLSADPVAAAHPVGLLQSSFGGH